MLNLNHLLLSAGIAS